MNSTYNVTLEERRILKKKSKQVWVIQKTIKRRLIVTITAMLL